MVHSIKIKKEVMKNIFINTVWLLMLAPVIYLIAVWQRLPVWVPLHYNLQGEVDRFGSKTELLVGVLLLTVVNIGVCLLLFNAHKIDTRKNADLNKEVMKRLAFAISFFIDALLCWFIYTLVSGNTGSFIPFLLTGIGILLSVIGNYFYNIKPNYFAGLRMRWTLQNENNWKRTHHLAGKLWFVGGLVIIACCFILTPLAAFISFMIILTFLIAIPLIYSWRLHQKQRSAH
jgi:uncharacterized membrane protein